VLAELTRFTLGVTARRQPPTLTLDSTVDVGYVLVGNDVAGPHTSYVLSSTSAQLQLNFCSNRAGWSYRVDNFSGFWDARLKVEPKPERWSSVGLYDVETRVPFKNIGGSGRFRLVADSDWRGAAHYLISPLYSTPLSHQLSAQL